MSFSHLSLIYFCHLSRDIIQEQAPGSGGFLLVLHYLMWGQEYQNALKKAEIGVLTIVYSKWSCCLELYYLTFLLNNQPIFHQW